MKRLFIFAFVLCLAGCGKKMQTENLAMKCQKANDYEFYSSTYVVGVFNTEDGNVTKIEIVENFTPKWEDVNVESLQNDLDTKKANLNKKYEKVTFKVDTYKQDITSDYSIPLTEKNLNQMKKEDSYKNAIKGDLFSIVDYWQYLEDNGYVCE